MKKMLVNNINFSYSQALSEKLDMLFKISNKTLYFKCLICLLSLININLSALQAPSDYYSSRVPQYYREPIILIDQKTLNSIKTQCKFDALPHSVAQFILEELQNNPLISDLKQLGIISFEGLNALVQKITDVIDIKTIYWKGGLKDLAEGTILKAPIVTYTLKGKPYEFQGGIINIKAPFDPKQSTLVPNLIDEILKHIIQNK